jgi:hypothetical protein
MSSISSYFNNHISISNLIQTERIAFAIVPVEVRYPDRIVEIALLLCSRQ